jgi:signal peptidase I
MQFASVIAAAAVLVWVVMTQGIETALALATLLCAVVWLGYLLIKRGKDRGDRPEPLAVDYARSFLPIFVVVLVLRSFVVEPFRIPSGSMLPTLLVGDFILVNKFSYGIRLPVVRTKVLEMGEPERGDVAVFRFPLDTKIDYIKRIVGVPGDRIAYKQKTLFVNGQPMAMSAIGQYQATGSNLRANGFIEATEQLADLKHQVLVNPYVGDFSPGCNVLRQGEITVPEGHYFAMGDNRDDSNDSRCWGLVPEQNLVGKAFMIWMSWDTGRSGLVAWDRLGTIIE